MIRRIDRYIFREVIAPTLLGLVLFTFVLLMNTFFLIAREVVEKLVGSAILKQLTRLDLSMGTMTGPGARAIVDNKDQFAHLEMLVLSENCIPAAEVAALQAAIGDQVFIGDQEDIDDYGYVSVGE